MTYQKVILKLKFHHNMLNLVYFILGYKQVDYNTRVKIGSENTGTYFFFQIKRE